MSIWFAILLFCCVNMAPEGSSGFQIDLGGEEQHVVTRQKDNSWKVESKADKRQRSYTFSCKGTEMTFVGLAPQPVLLNLEEIVGRERDWAAFKSIEYKGSSLTLSERTAEALNFTQISKMGEKVLETRIKVTFTKAQ